MFREINLIMLLSDFISIGLIIYTNINYTGLII